jgi:hypothetical protein
VLLLQPFLQICLQSLLQSHLQDKEAAAKAKKEAAKAKKEAFKPLTSWWKEQLGSKVRGL